ncbi:PCI domain containing protein [Coniochaeta hoffmannii]|uniref:COP9 signalosome complex subunit 4 n=1 Tax=Coniochaeta hoffmannii TaxID=91930 RepID=A0AA38VP93_9PEZI|nr:PCI domain containing protein [Coniochaeta hoffmannii]
MAPTTVSEALQQITGSDNPAAGFESLLGSIKNISTPSTIAGDLNSIAAAILSSSLGVVGTRTVLAQFVDTLRALDNDELWTEVGPDVVNRLLANASAASFVEQVASLCEGTASAFEATEDFQAAAEVLAKIPIDSSQRRLSDQEKARIWIRIVRNYLEEKNWNSAEAYLNKLKNIMHTITDSELNLHFKLSAARIQDAKREFLAAAQSYHDISNMTVIAEEERLHTLAMAIKCAILAPAGPPRSRVLGRLYKDERSAGLEEYGILEKIFLDRLLAPAEVAKFAEGLQEHQLAITSDGSTVLDRAVVEHNLLGASRLYSNIGFDALGHLLGLDGDRAEDTTARMIEQGRLAGWIDQIDRIIWFGSGEASGEKGSGRAEAVVGKELRRWDANVQALAEELEQVTNSLHTEFPAFVEQRLAA